MGQTPDQYYNGQVPGYDPWTGTSFVATIKGNGSVKRESTFFRKQGHEGSCANRRKWTERGGKGGGNQESEEVYLFGNRTIKAFMIIHDQEGKNLHS